MSQTDFWKIHPYLLICLDEFSSNRPTSWPENRIFVKIGLVFQRFEILEKIFGWAFQNLPIGVRVVSRNRCVPWEIWIEGNFLIKVFFSYGSTVFWDIVKWGASYRWSFCPNSAWGSTAMTFGKTHSTLTLFDHNKIKFIFIRTSLVCDNYHKGVMFL